MALLWIPLSCVLINHDRPVIEEPVLKSILPDKHTIIVVSSFAVGWTFLQGAFETEAREFRTARHLKRISKRSKEVHRCVRMTHG